MVFSTNHIRGKRNIYDKNWNRYTKRNLINYSTLMTNITSPDSVRLSVYSFTLQRVSPWPYNKLSRNYVPTSTTHATVFNLQPCKLCKEERLSIKFAHPDWLIICKRKTLLGGKACHTVLIIIA